MNTKTIGHRAAIFASLGAITAIGIGYTSVARAQEPRAARGEESKKVSSEIQAYFSSPKVVELFERASQSRSLEEASRILSGSEMLIKNKNFCEACNSNHPERGGGNKIANEINVFSPAGKGTDLIGEKGRGIVHVAIFARPGNKKSTPANTKKDFDEIVNLFSSRGKGGAMLEQSESANRPRRRCRRCGWYGHWWCFGYRDPFGIRDRVSAKLEQETSKESEKSSIQYKIVLH
jgi:hypothetical protein